MRICRKAFDMHLQKLAPSIIQSYLTHTQNICSNKQRIISKSDDNQYHNQIALITEESRFTET